MAAEMDKWEKLARQLHAGPRSIEAVAIALRLAYKEGYMAAATGNPMVSVAGPGPWKRETGG